MRRLLYGEWALARFLLNPGEPSLGLVSPALLREGARSLTPLDAEALFGDGLARDALGEEPFPRWRQLYIDAAGRGEAIIVGAASFLAAPPRSWTQRGGVGMGVAWILYGLARVGVAAAGVLTAAAALACFLLAPELFYDPGPPPPLGARLPGLTAWLGASALMLLPNAWTPRGRLFWARLTASAAVGLILLTVGVGAAAMGLQGGRDPVIFPAAAGFALTGVALPGCLWWRARLTRGGGGEPPGTDHPAA